jgi:trigger factor
MTTPEEEVKTDSQQEEQQQQEVREEKKEEPQEKQWHHLATVHDLGGLRRRLDITYDSEAVQMAFDKATTAIGRQVTIKGFRRGRAPKAVVENFCRDEIRKGASSLLSQEGYLHAVYENNLSPMSKPDVKDAMFHMDGTFSCSVFIEVRPDVKPAGYIGLKLDRPEVDQEAIAERLLEGLKEKFTRMEDGTEAAPGSMVTVDYRVSAGDDVLTDMKGQAFMIAPDGGSPLGKDLTGMAVGDVRDDKMTLPDDLEAHGGEEASVRIELKRVQNPVRPSDEELAVAAAGEDSTIGSYDDLMGKVRQHAAFEASKQIRQKLEAQVVEQLLDMHEFEVPEQWINDEVTYLMSQMNVQNPDEQVQKAMRDLAEKNVRRTFIMDAIYDAERQLHVQPEDIKQFIAAEAARLGIPEIALRRKIIKQNMMEQVAGSLKNRKIMDFLIAGAHIGTDDQQEAGAAVEEILPPTDDTDDKEEEPLIIVPPAD